MKWEYKLVLQPKGLTTEELRVFLNQHGQTRWELCAIDYGCFIFRRQII